MGTGKVFGITFCIAIALCTCSGQRIHPSCNRTTATPVTPSVTDLADIVKFFKSQQVTTDILKDAINTELFTIRNILAFQSGADNEDVHMYITDLIKKYGFPAEEHEVETQDGYLLTMQRIPGNGSVVFLQHAMFSSADDFVTAGPVSALAYYLARRGFDVWLGNSRGNKHSRKSATTSPECAEFWNFSYDEVGRYDLPAMIDYALAETGHQQLAFVGHSLGNTAFLVMASELPAYNDKISVAISLCPIAFAEHTRSIPFRLLALNNDLAYTFLTAIGLDEFISDGVLTRTLTSVFCGNNPLAAFVCSNLVNFIFGFDLAQQNVTNLAVNFGHTPAGASTKQVVHFSQGVQSGRFCQFNYPDKTKNVEKYGSESPPDYPLGNITVPMALFYSNTDWISNVTDVETLRGRLPNVIEYRLLDHYWHFDYLWATNVNALVNPKILDLIQKYPSK